MIQAEELMIGNYVTGNNDPEMKVVSINENEIQLRFEGADPDYGDWFYQIQEIKPIPLTDDWLRKLGFEQDENVWFNQISLYPSPTGFNYNGSFFEHENLVSVDYVHELQRLYLTLTQEKLTIKQGL